MSCDSDDSPHGSGWRRRSADAIRKRRLRCNQNGELFLQLAQPALALVAVPSSFKQDTKRFIAAKTIKVEREVATNKLANSTRLASLGAFRAGCINKSQLASDWVVNKDANLSRHRTTNSQWKQFVESANPKSASSGSSSIKNPLWADIAIEDHFPPLVADGDVSCQVSPPSSAVDPLFLPMQEVRANCKSKRVWRSTERCSVSCQTDESIFGCGIVENSHRDMDQATEISPVATEAIAAAWMSSPWCQLPPVMPPLCSNQVSEVVAQTHAPRDILFLDNLIPKSSEVIWQLHSTCYSGSDTSLTQVPTQAQTQSLVGCPASSPTPTHPVHRLVSCKHNGFHPFLIRHWSDDGGGCSLKGTACNADASPLGPLIKAAVDDNFVDDSGLGELIDRVGKCESRLLNLETNVIASVKGVASKVVGLLPSLITPVVQETVANLEQTLKDTFMRSAEISVQALKVESGACGSLACAQDFIHEEQFDVFQGCIVSNNRNMSDGRASLPDPSIHMHDIHCTPLHEACPSTSRCDKHNLI